jgi:predicted nucleic acid-binding protein
MRRIFADANVLIAGADSRSGASHAVLLLAEAGLFQIVVSRQVIDEAERNLRKKMPRALGHFAEILAVLNLEILADPAPEDWQKWRSIIEAKDAPILEAAVATRVDRFLTLNTRDFTTQVADASGLTIQTPAEFITDLRDLVSGGLAAP